nr:hypothetical protein [uncultured bacterium]
MFFVFAIVFSNLNCFVSTTLVLVSAAKLAFIFLICKNIEKIFVSMLTPVLSRRLKIQSLQEVLAEAWKPYMKDLDTVYTDATCYESAMRYPTDAKLLWECIEKVYPMMCEASRELGIHRMRTKYLDVARDNMAPQKHSMMGQLCPDGTKITEKNGKMPKNNRRA